MNGDEFVTVTLHIQGGPKISHCQELSLNCIKTVSKARLFFNSKYEISTIIL